ncbi:MAG: hypothetical protein A2030_05625, partial [Chloroflexi bacterium RBG_19FT_COMBO_50_10]
MTVYPLSAVRTMALYAQGLTTRNGVEAEPTRSSICRMVEQLGCVQIDTLNLVRRSHYLVLWSRLGTYNPADFDSLVYNNEHRQLFEGWQRIASIIPIIDYRYQIPHQNRLKNDPSEGYTRLFDNEGLPLMNLVLERIRKEGALRAADFEYQGPKRGSWWDWKPAKTALEYLYAFGELMISDRVNFQRVYDLTERVLPAWVDTTPPSMDQRDRYWLEQAALALGIASPMQMIGYSYYKKGGLKPILEGLVDEGVLVEVQAEQVDGPSQPMLVHRDKMGLLEQITGGAMRAGR